MPWKKNEGTSIKLIPLYMENKDFTARNVEWSRTFNRKLHDDLILSSFLSMFISCSAPAGSGPELGACPDFPLWHVIISLQRGRKVTRSTFNHQQIIVLSQMRCHANLFSIAGFLIASLKTCTLQFYWTDVLHNCFV